MAVTSLIHFRPLASTDAERIHRLQRKLFPKPLREPLSEIRQILANAELHMVCNFSFGLFDDTRMIGYVFAWIESRSVVYSRDEEVVYIKEVGLLRGYENQLRRLLQKLLQQRQVYSPGLPLEAHALPESLAHWRRLTRLYRRYGLTLTDSAGAGSKEEPPYRLLRFDCDADAAGRAEEPQALPATGWAYDENISVNVLSSPNQWLALRERWDELLAETSDSNVLQSFDYLWLWWKYHGLWRELAVFVVRDRGEVVGVVPLMIDFYRVYGRTMRNLLFMTSRMDMSRPKLIFGRNAERCLPAFVAWLKQHPTAWDIVDLDEQLPNEATARLRDSLVEHKYLLAETETICPYIDFTSSWDEFLRSRSSKMRGNVNRLRRRLAEAGDVQVRTVRTLPELERAFDTHCEIESRSWKAEAGLELADSRENYHFHHALSAHFGRRGDFEHRILTCGGQSVASTYGIAHEGVFQSLKIAHDSEYDRFSPGTLLESFEIESLHGGDLWRYEFLGSFVANKLRWTSDVITTTSLHAFRRRPRLVVFYFFYFEFRTRIKAFLKRIGQFDRVLDWFQRANMDPFPRYD